MPRTNPALTKDEIFTILADADVAKAVAHFSGGNDSGCVEDIYFLDASGARINRASLVDVPAEAGYRDLYDYNDRTHEWSIKPGAPAAAKLRDALEAPVFATYGSFAGDFYVDGEVIYDVVERTVKMTRSEQVWSEADSVDIDF